MPGIPRRELVYDTLGNPHHIYRLARQRRGQRFRRSAGLSGQRRQSRLKGRETAPQRGRQVARQRGQVGVVLVQEAPGDAKVNVVNQAGLETAAEAPGMTADELSTQLWGGNSLADTAGVDLQTVHDAVDEACEGDSPPRARSTPSNAKAQVLNAKARRRKEA